jgi:hypothetical protein
MLDWGISVSEEIGETAFVSGPLRAEVGRALYVLTISNRVVSLTSNMYVQLFILLTDLVKL